MHRSTNVVMPSRQSHKSHFAIDVTRKNDVLSLSNCHEALRLWINIGDLSSLRQEDKTAAAEGRLEVVQKAFEFAYELDQEGQALNQADFLFDQKNEADAADTLLRQVAISFTNSNRD